ncbi:hypothetical protein ACLE20_07060 [Rhizobium sp. YIM 134829]|uniref:hypothetical protein n=1 Tax=Rhizobium sp. YIM 134829 TaxID=3390453 RepID=UPI00397D0D1E
MRKIEIVDDLFLRFPGRGGEFDVGVEVGVVSVLMAQSVPFIQRTLSINAVEQLRPIAESLRYSLTSVPAEQGMAMLTLTPRSKRPMLRIV